MDVNGNGKVTRAEFLEFMLVAMNKIDYDLVDELHEYFNKLDSRGTGELSRADLVENARRKLKDTRRKLELAAYKQQLLNKAASKRHRPNIFSRIRFFRPTIQSNSGLGDPESSCTNFDFEAFLSEELSKDEPEK